MTLSDLFIKGGAFSVPTELKGILSKRMNILFGRNGSGKSTIARAFREQQPDYQSKHLGRQFELSHTRGKVSLDDDMLRHVFVFNEDFVDENVKTSSNLKSIIRIGSSAELDVPISELKEKIKQCRNDQKNIGPEIDRLDAGPAATGSIKEAETKMKNGLKADGGYMSRLERIEGKSHNLGGKVLNQVLEIPAPESLPVSVSEAVNQLNREIDRYLSFQGGTEITWTPPVLGRCIDIESVNSLLCQTIRPAALTDDERALLEELSGDLAPLDFIDKSQSVILDRSSTVCPLCHQPLTEEHRHTLEVRLLRFRDKRVEDFKETVRVMMEDIHPVCDQLPTFSTKDYSEDAGEASSAISQLNSFILEVKNALEKKYQNPFINVNAICQEDFKRLVESFEKSLAKISDDVAEFNRKILEKDKLRDYIEKTNIGLAYMENQKWVDEYKARQKARETLDTKNKALENAINSYTEEIGRLSAKIDQVDEAREQINHYLGLIFGFQKLKLVPAGKDSYKLQIKNGDTYVDIPTRCVSSGERNAIALAYFFACVMEKKDKNYDYSDETVLVIDDPVSSYDSENKAGVISLLSQQCKKVLNGNRDSKVLILTHDQTTLKAICAEREKICPRRNQEDRDNDFYSILSLSHKLRTAPTSRILPNMEYNDNLLQLFYFADHREPEEFDAYDTIGNTIRKFSEDYASRTYKCPWFELFSDPERTTCIPEEYRDSICNFATRNVLNSESHGNIDAYSPGEVQRSARILLSYMYFADREHLAAYLVGKKADFQWRMDKVKKWAESFKQ